MTDYKIILGGVAVVLGLIGYGFYIRDVLRGSTKLSVSLILTNSAFVIMSLLRRGKLRQSNMY